MSRLEYAIHYEGQPLIRDDSWLCVADVVASYNGGFYNGPDGRVTGILLQRLRGTEDAWEPVS